MRDIVNLLATSLPPHCHLTFLARKLTVLATQATPGAPDVDVSVPNDALNRTSSMWVGDRAATRRRSHEAVSLHRGPEGLSQRMLWE